MEPIPAGCDRVADHMHDFVGGLRWAGVVLSLSDDAGRSSAQRQPSGSWTNFHDYQGCAGRLGIRLKFDLKRHKKGVESSQRKGIQI